MGFSVSLGKYGKAIIAVLGTVTLVLSDNIFDANDLVQVVVAAATAFGVWGVTNAEGVYGVNKN